MSSIPHTRRPRNTLDVHRRHLRIETLTVDIGNRSRLSTILRTCIARGVAPVPHRSIVPLSDLWIGRLSGLLIDQFWIDQWIDQWSVIWNDAVPQTHTFHRVTPTGIDHASDTTTVDGHGTIVETPMTGMVIITGTDITMMGVGASIGMSRSDTLSITEIDASKRILIVRGGGRPVTPTCTTLRRRVVTNIGDDH